MNNPKGVKLYKQFWEDQAEFMDREPWAKEKIVKINLLAECEALIKELGFSSHSISNENGKLMVKIKVPYNFQELDDFETKALELLGINQRWLIEISINDSHCNSSHW